MSKLNFDKKVEKLTSPFTYRGLVFEMRTVPNIGDYHRRLSEINSEMGVGDLLSSDLTDADRYLMQQAGGIAVAEVLVLGMESFVINEGDKDEEVITYESPSDMDVYATQCHELLGENTTIQDAVFMEASRRNRKPPDFEVKALEKSSPPSGSGGNATKVAG